MTIAIVDCPQCGRSVPPRPAGKRGRQPKYCSALCRHRAYHDARVADGRWETQAAKRRTTTKHPCVECGKSIWTGERCGPCYRGAVKSKRAIPPGDRLATYERDGWICKLCGDPVEREAKAPHPLSPSIDHVIPLSECIRRFGWEYQDGMHNWQTAHYVCNCRKGNRGLTHSCE